MEARPPATVADIAVRLIRQTNFLMDRQMFSQKGLPKQPDSRPSALRGYREYSCNDRTSPAPPRAAAKPLTVAAAAATVVMYGTRYWMAALRM